ncbi:diguanylate cyclase domain-containing protein [Thermodesulfobacteriota bacterium]
MKKTIIIVIMIWSIIVGISFLWNYSNAKNEQKSIAFQSARSFFNQIVITREWNAGHNGVYVPVTDKTRPNLHLADPSREIRVDQNLVLTKINPAFMTRQISEIAAESEGVRFHLTNLKPLRPGNRPTKREESALRAFESGTKEIGEIVHDESSSHIFYIAPLKTEKVCLECHAKQGYQEGDIIGGISVTLPFIPKMAITELLLGHIGIGSVGVLGILFFGGKLTRAYDIIKKQAVIDSLTGIPNRRSFSEHIANEINRSRRGRYPLSIIMCDIDHFKTYNDTCGHKAGDECLRQVAQVIKNTIERPGDFCARYGGEEFIILLPNTVQEGAMHMAENIRTNVQNLGIPHTESTLQPVVSLSLGVATAEGDGEISDEELVKQADTALYSAKEKGRNRVELYREKEDGNDSGCEETESMRMRA